MKHHSSSLIRSLHLADLLLQLAYPRLVYVNQLVELLPPLSDAVNRLLHLHHSAAPPVLILPLQPQNLPNLFVVAQVAFARVVRKGSGWTQQLDHGFYGGNGLLLFPHHFSLLQLSQSVFLLSYLAREGGEESAFLLHLDVPALHLPQFICPFSGCLEANVELPDLLLILSHYQRQHFQLLVCFSHLLL